MLLNLTGPLFAFSLIAEPHFDFSYFYYTHITNMRSNLTVFPNPRTNLASASISYTTTIVSLR